MRRVTKKLLIFVLGLLFTFIYCEFLVYYVVAGQCSWPTIEQPHNDSEVLKAFILADTHLLGPRKGHWLDKWRREWQMHQAFEAIMMIHKPDVVFVLGDLFDEGEWSNDIQFKDYVDRFHRLFPIPDETLMYVVAGNHDIGFHNNIRMGSDRRFTKQLNSTAVQFITLKDSHFVMINSMAMEGDSCSLCTKARNEIIKVGGVLKCSENPDFCYEGIKKVRYSRPILMQHFPLYRKSDETCTEPDAPPLSIRNKPFRLKIDALSKEATDYLVSRLKPRVVFGGHTHHGCLQHHEYRTSESSSLPLNFYEYSVPSFSWRNRPDPKYMLNIILGDNNTQ
ncbi:metallophosphoesterase 1-like isoform X2 [Trichoplusia ni]|uniref:Metallophosphoesterase 1-like isoform X2 n=1 Tax=Trichoplusia ni TaxID=7111 RepID=A0A7E5VSW1_TRINI|nr:metallophosphoesterase 1-like isoform X2 [Trichoplusia ni]